LTLTVSVDKESLVENEQIAKYIINNFSGRVMGDLYLQISHNIPDAKIGDSAIYNDKFAITIQEFPIDTKDKLIDVSKKLRVDYLIIDDEVDRRYPIFDDIFKHETDYPFLEKVFDSDQAGYQKIHVKIFKIKSLEEG
jgi:hypothetical protein